MSFLADKLHPEEKDSRSLISSTVQLGFKKGIVHHSELSILESFLDFREKTAEDLLIPRTELNAIDSKASLSELTKLTEKLGSNALIPVFQSTIDRITGYINVRDLLPYRFGIATAKTVAPLIKPIHPVPSSKNLLELLQEVMEKDCEMALVVDEYGGTAGIVTFQHLVEDFLYFFYPSKEEYAKIDDTTYRFPGKFELERVEVLFDKNFESESRTISGFVTEQLEEIPAVGATLQFDQILFTVRAVSRKKILEVEATKTG